MFFYLLIYVYLLNARLKIEQNITKMSQKLIDNHYHLIIILIIVINQTLVS